MFVVACCGAVVVAYCCCCARAGGELQAVVYRPTEHGVRHRHRSRSVSLWRWVRQSRHQRVVSISSASGHNGRMGLEYAHTLCFLCLFRVALLFFVVVVALFRVVSCCFVLRCCRCGAFSFFVLIFVGFVLFVCFVVVVFCSGGFKLVG